MSQFYNNAIFWVEVEKIKPNPFQPRREFDEAKLADLAKSIRQYGVIQPLTVTRKEVEKQDGGLATEYELIAGERRLRAAKLAGVSAVPVLIRAEHDDDKTKLELAIIENLQREDLNPIDRAKAFEQLAKQFGFKHIEIAEKVGKSREYVSNTLRLLLLPQDMQTALQDGKISEGHTRPLLMLVDRPEEQVTLFREILLKHLTVRDTEAIARRIAFDRIRNKKYLYAPEILEMEKNLADALGTRVSIEHKEHGGKLTIDFVTEDDLRAIFDNLAARVLDTKSYGQPTQEKVLGGPPVADKREDATVAPDHFPGQVPSTSTEQVPAESSTPETAPEDATPIDDRTREEKSRDENTFDPNTFSL